MLKSNTASSSPTLELDLELCRALHDKDPDRMLELLSEWLEVHQLTTSHSFNVPPYLKLLLADINPALRPH